MPLTADELSTFIRDGAVIKRGLVPRTLITDARQLIDDWYTTGLDPAHLTTYTQRSFAPDLSDHPALLALFHDSGVAQIARDLLGEINPVITTQIQIRVPDAAQSTSQPIKAMHVDGVACPHLDPDELRTFNLIAGLVLSDITDPSGGALRYVPGGHHTMAEWFADEWSLGLTDQVPPRIDTDTGTAFLGTPGDVLLMHHLVPHSVGANTTTQPRIMAYFRVSHPSHADHRLDALRQPWLDYHGLTAALAT